MEPRYYPRISVTGSACFAGAGFTSDGTVLDVTLPGCLIQSSFPLRKGVSVKLRLTLSEVKATFLVTQAVVRWVNGSRFGVEFIEMDPTEQSRFNATVRGLLRRQAPYAARPAWKRSYRKEDFADWVCEAAAA